MLGERGRRCVCWVRGGGGVCEGSEKLVVAMEREGGEEEGCGTLYLTKTDQEAFFHL